ncbi:MAG: hypothetical protein P8L32_04465 [Paracoccaceae bacterium]|nr:hypothetical protein [Paracoccaceae bacterium]
MADLSENGLTAELPKIVLQEFDPSLASCTFSTNISGAISFSCHWGFSYRTKEALEAFEAMLSDLALCADPTLGVVTDQNVNHPDFYDLRMLNIQGGEIALSLKDKAALQQTFIFLRLTPKP